MTVALSQVLPPNVVTRVVSQQAAASDWLQALFGVQPGGPNEVYEGHGRQGAYTIFNNTRAIAQGRAPGTAHAVSNEQGVGVVPFTYPRMHDSLSLLAEQLHNLGRIDNPTVRDGAYQDMLARQEKFLGQRASNWRKAMLVGALRNSLYLVRDGQDEYVSFSSVSGKSRQVNSQIPAGNLSKLNMLGAGDILGATWSTSTTDIPGHLGLINAAFQQLCGGHLSACVCGTKVWNYVINNEKVAAVHGSANSPFRVLERSALDPMLGNTMKNVYRAVLNVYPDITWYITDEGLDVGAPGSETFTKIVGENNCLFVGAEPNSGVVSMYQGSEPIAEYDGAPESVKVGLSAWMYKQSNPTRTNIVTLDNALPVLHIPNAMAYGLVVY